MPHSGGQLKVPGWVSNFSTINCSTMVVADDEACSENSVKAGLASAGYSSNFIHDIVSTKT